MFRVVFICKQRSGGTLPESPLFSCKLITPERGFEDRLWKVKPDLIVIDASEPELAARLISVVKSERAPYRLPFILIIPALTPTFEQMLAGAEEFLVEPYTEKELLIRITRTLSRLFGSSREGIIRHGELEIDLKERRVTIAGESVLLTLKEFELLRLLASHPGRVFTRDTLLSRIWGYDYIGGSRTVDVHIRRLRVKIEKHGARFIETVHGLGYRFSPDTRT